MTRYFSANIYLLVFLYHHHHHHIVLAARISLTLSRHSSLSFIALGRSSGQQVHTNATTSTKSGCKYNSLFLFFIGKRNSSNQVTFSINSPLNFPFLFRHRTLPSMCTLICLHYFTPYATKINVLRVEKHKILLLK